MQWRLRNLRQRKKRLSAALCESGYTAVSRCRYTLLFCQGSTETETAHEGPHDLVSNVAGIVVHRICDAGPRAAAQVMWTPTAIPVAAMPRSDLVC